MRSKFESNVSKILKRNKISYVYEPCKLPFIIETNYIPDFEIREGVFIECKGVLDPVERKKLLSIKKCHPDITLYLWFQRDNYLTKAKKAKYSDWATKHGFESHVGLTFPDHWFKK